MDKKLLNVYITPHGSLRFEFEPGAEEMLETHNLQDLVGDTIAEFGENYRHHRHGKFKHVPSEDSGKRIIIPKGAIF